MDNTLLNLVLNGTIELDFDTLVLLYMMMDRKPELSIPQFNLSECTDDFCLENFRFEKKHILELKSALRIPDVLRCSKHLRFDGTEGLCLLLRRLAYPNRLCDLSLIFRRKKNILSMMFNTMLKTIIADHGHLLEGMDHWWINAISLIEFSDSIHRQGSPLTNCVGFIDGTVRAICKPGKYQREVYNGHKRKHALKFQSVIVPNGLICNLFGPISGRRHDSYMLSESNLLTHLQLSVPGYCIYGDPAYPHRPQLQAPFKGSHLSADQQQFNARMSMNRVVVEWAFGKIISLFAFLDFKKNLKLYLQPIANLYKVGVILTNCHTCLYGSQTTFRFGVNPPNLYEYLNGPN